ncbi:hypothetical protein LJK87_47960 [Paenibacillus sp. P25]|nr:hypothetical protein LJK87_47960 [Paenibacillus sp. P25]
MKLASFIRLLRFKRGMLAIAFILLLAMALTGGGGSAYAHASLVEAVPVCGRGACGIAAADCFDLQRKTGGRTVLDTGV